MMNDVIMIHLIVYTRVTIFVVKQLTRRTIDVFINEINFKNPRKIYITKKPLFNILLTLGV